MLTQYCLNKGKSSYTVNDYCSRIKNLWRSFLEEHHSGQLRDDLSFEIPEILRDGVLMNVYDNVDVLKEYVNDKIIKLGKNRNRANTRAAFNRFYEFVKSIEG